MAQNRRYKMAHSLDGVGGHATKELDRVQVDEAGLEHVDASLLTTFEHLLHVIKQGNAGLLTRLLQRRPKFDLSRLDQDFQTCLHHAARYDRAEALQLLLDVSTTLDVNVRGAEGWSPLHTAARFSAVGCARLLLQRPRVDINAVNDLGLTPLHLAAKYSNLAVASLLLDSGARVDVKDNEGRLPIVYAVKSSNTELCALLRSRQSPLFQVKDNAGKTPFASACQTGNTAMMRTLLGLVSPLEGSQMLRVPDLNGVSPLHYAVMSGSQDAVSLLISARVPIDALSSKRRTPLFLACLAGNCDIARLLASAGANVNLADSQGTSPLHLASQKQKPDLAELLLDWGADPTAQDAEFRTALHVACQTGPLSVIQTVAVSSVRNLASRDHGMRTCLHLLAARPQPDLPVAAFRHLMAVCEAEELRTAVSLCDGRGESVLHAAVRANNDELVRLLLGLEPDTDLRSTEDLTAAELAAVIGCLECGRLLLDPAAGRQSLAVTNNSALLAAKSGHLEFVEFLLASHRLDVNWTDQFGCSALMHSVAGGHTDIAARLIESGCDVNLQDKSQNTALHYAAKQDKAGGCVQILMDSGAKMTESCTGEVPLDLAATSGNEAAIEIFLSPEHFEEFKAFRRSTGGTLFDVLIEHAPKYAIKVLDNSIIKSKCGVLDKDFSVTLDFQALDPGPYDPSSRSSFYWGAKTMARNMRHDLLTHPVTSVLTLRKWRTFGRYYFITDLLLYLLFMSANTNFILTQQPPLPNELNTVTGCLNATNNGRSRPLSNNQLITEKYLVFIFMCVRLLLEVVKLIFKRWRYFLSEETYFHLALIGTTIAFMWPPSYEPCMYNWVCGAFSIALTWGVFLFQLQHIPHLGIYSIMFQYVVTTLIKALAVFAFLLTGFTMAFYITNRQMDTFKSYDKAFMKTFDMTLGEYEYETYFEAMTGIFKPYAQIIFVIFAIVVSIALINLLVGLAVGDIETIQRNSSTKLITIRVELLCELHAIFPRWVQKRLHRSTMKLYPNKRQYENCLLKCLLGNPYVDAYLKAELLRNDRAM